MPSPEVADAAPLWTQIALGVAGVGSFLGMIAAALRPKKDEIATHAAVTETVSMADEKPYRDGLEHIEAYLRRIADNTDTLVAMIRKRIEEAERMQIRAEARQEAQEEESRKRINAKLEEIDRAERDRRGEPKPAGR